MLFLTTASSFFRFSASDILILLGLAVGLEEMHHESKSGWETMTSCCVHLILVVAWSGHWKKSFGLEICHVCGMCYGVVVHMSIL